MTRSAKGIGNSFKKGPQRVGWYRLKQFTRWCKEDQKIKQKEYHVDLHVRKNIRYLVGLDNFRKGKSVGEVSGSPEAMLNIHSFTHWYTPQRCENKTAVCSVSLLCGGHEHLSVFGGAITDLLSHSTNLQQESHCKGGNAFLLTTNVSR